MKTTFKITKCLILLSFFLIFSCSSDDDGPSITPLSAQNFVVTVDENQADATSLGTIQASGEGTLSFSITSQTPAGALAINASTGELTVADASAFDFETNTVISATVTVVDSQSTVTATVAINLNDVDAIESLLTTSQADFSAAAAGDWVMITDVEYNALASSLNEVTKVATTDAEYDTSGAILPSSSNWTFANNNGLTMPNSSYVFAFKYNSINDAVVNSKVKQSNTSVSDGYMDLGGNLPSHDTGDQYFVLKGSNNATTSTGFLAIYASNGLGGKSLSGSLYENSSGDSNSLTSSNDIVILYQGLSTTQMQW